MGSWRSTLWIHYLNCSLTCHFLLSQLHRVPEPECRHVPAHCNTAEAQALVAEHQAMDHPDCHHPRGPGRDHQ